jgi:predicted DNA-binding protein (MmcQ/YjbR family)
MAKDIDEAVREVCLWLPEAEEYLSHGSPNFRVRGKTFAAYVVNHHGDGRVALWLNSPPGAQYVHTSGSPRHFFVPPYVGPRGWLGVHLNKGLSWKRVAALVREAYEKVAPPSLAATLGKTLEIAPPKKALAASRVDPLKTKRAQSVLKGLRKICLALPESSEGKQFGSPVWFAGKRVFASAYARDKVLTLSFWVGVDRQALLCADERFSIPPYVGHNGWIAFDVTTHCNWQEVRQLAFDSYRHFALKRMLSALRD